MARERDALVAAYVRLNLLRQHSLGPVARQLATDGAAACLWGLEIDERDGIKAKAPDGPIVDAGPVAHRLGAPE